MFSASPRKSTTIAPHSSPCTGVILAGGGATRFGGIPKGLLPVGGVRIIDRVHHALKASCDRVIVVANAPDAINWLPGVPVFPDILPGHGGLGGIHTALKVAAESVVVVAWDMPFVPPTLLVALREAGGDSDAVLPASGSRRGVEPLCSWYSQACLPAIEQALTSGDRRTISFHADVRLRVLSYAEVARHGDANTLFMNVNTAEDLALAEIVLEQAKTSG